MDLDRWGPRRYNKLNDAGIKTLCGLCGRADPTERGAPGDAVAGLHRKEPLVTIAP